MTSREPDNATNQAKVFKVCPMCAFTWEDRAAFLADRTLYYNGYQADFEEEEKGLFYFTHRTAACGSTMTIEAKHFLSLYSGAHYEHTRRLSEKCPRYCLESSELRRCPTDCRHAFVREISQILLDRHSATAAELDKERP